MEYQELTFEEVISRYNTFHQKSNDFELGLLHKLDEAQLCWYAVRVSVEELSNVVLPYHRESGCGGGFRILLRDKVVVPLRGAALSKMEEKRVNHVSLCSQKISSMSKLGTAGPIILMYENRPISISHLFLGKCQDQLVCVDGLHRLLALSTKEDAQLVDVIIAADKKHDFNSSLI